MEMPKGERSIYLDNNATTEVAGEVVEAVTRALASGWGNPSSQHGFGSHAHRIVEEARQAVMRLVGAASPDEILFTSGGTESINTAIHAALGDRAGTGERRRVLTSAVEHSAVRQPLERARGRGCEVLEIGVDGEGRLDADACARAIGPDVALVTLQLANNETGALLEHDSLAHITDTARSQGVPVHLDAVQGPGKLPLRVNEFGCDLLSISAHKFHGPKGVGALWIRTGALASFSPLVLGGPQERERRGGTQNVPGIAGLGCAADLAREHVADPSACARVRALRDELEQGLLRSVEGVRLHATAGPRLDNTTSAFFPGVESELLLASLDAEGLAVSGGAACSSLRRGPSTVLSAMGCGEEEATGTLRFSLSRRTRREEILRALQLVPRVVEELRALSSP